MFNSANNVDGVSVKHAFSYNLVEAKMYDVAYVGENFVRFSKKAKWHLLILVLRLFVWRGGGAWCVNCGLK